MIYYNKKIKLQIEINKIMSNKWIKFNNNSKTTM